MRNCPFCGSHNRPGILYCEECGRHIEHGGIGGVVVTRQIEQEEELHALNVGGTATFSPDYYLIMHIRDANEPLVLQPTKRIVFGRTARNNMRKPDVDLTPYDALEKGVSQIHAAIRFDGNYLTVVDMGSVNGTYLNGERLPANNECLVHDGDELRMGKLVAHMYFQNA